LAGQSFLPEVDQRARLEVLAAIVRRLTCWQLTLDDPRAAAATVRRVVEAASSRVVGADETEGAGRSANGGPTDSVVPSRLADSLEGNPT